MNRRYVLSAGVLVFCAAMIGLTYSLFDRVFPKAETIRMPAVTDVESVTLRSSVSGQTAVIAEAYYEELFAYIADAEPTRRQSVNDQPDTDAYYEVIVQAGDDTCDYMVYEDDSAVLIEMPYEGIWEGERKLLEWIRSRLP